MQFRSSLRLGLCDAESWGMGQEDLPPCWPAVARTGTPQQGNSGSLYVALLSRRGTCCGLHYYKVPVLPPLSKSVFTDRGRRLLELCSAAKRVLGNHGGAGRATVMCAPVIMGRGKQDFHL